MKSIVKLAAAAALATSALLVTSVSASADIVCNRDGDCWHVSHRYHYRYHDEFGIVVHPDGWAWRTGEHYRWHEHRGRGYWRHGIWITF